MIKAKLSVDVSASIAAGGAITSTSRAARDGSTTILLSAYIAAGGAITSTSRAARDGSTNILIKKYIKFRLTRLIVLL